MTTLLRPYRRQLVAQRRDGYSLRQVLDRLKASPRPCDISPSTPKEIMAGPTGKRRTKLKKLAAQRAANMTAAKANPIAKSDAPAAGAVAESK